MRGCGYLPALPVAALVARFGELFPVEFAIMKVRCGGCGQAGKLFPDAEATVAGFRSLRAGQIHRLRFDTP